MAFVRQRYGKANVRVLRVQRDGDRHQVRESRVTIILDGEFSRAYTDADNVSVVATDTMKNLVNVLAFEHLDAANESFALTYRAVLRGPLFSTFRKRASGSRAARSRRRSGAACGSTAASTGTDS